jgi:hypothetical protein
VEVGQEQWDKYASTVLRRPGRGAPLVGARAASRLPLPEPLHVLTAWNPGGLVRLAGVNKEANEQLAAVLDARSFCYLPVIGTSADGRWREESLAVAGMHRPTRS